MTANRFATSLKPPYYAVIFTSQQSGDKKGYEETAARMFELAQTMPGYLGVESTCDESGLGILTGKTKTQLLTGKQIANTVRPGSRAMKNGMSIMN